MSWVAVGTAAVGAVSAYAQADAKSNASPGAPGNAGGLPSFTSPSAASYGTTLGNDGWSINFGSGTQIATPTETNTASYPTQDNPLNQLQPQYLLPDGSSSIAGMDTQTLLLLGLGGLVLVKALRRS